MERSNVSKVLPKEESGGGSKQQACLNWADSLHNLLKDSEGVKLFLEYLENEGVQYADCLHFWFACEGLKNHNDSEKIQKLIKVIYKTYFLKSALPIGDELRKEIRKKIKIPKQDERYQCLDTPITLFDEAQLQIETLMNNTTYPNFLKSDLYLKYLRSVQNPEDFSSESSSSSSSISKDYINLASGPLPTLHEDAEFTVNQPAHLLSTPGTGSVGTGYQTPLSGPIRLTKDLLLMSQKQRALEIRPKTETFAGSLYRSGSAIHSAYNSYNPVSRQDSDKQSLSSTSDVRTECDNLSFIESAYDGCCTSGRPQSRHKMSSSSTSNQGKNMIIELALRNKENDSIFFIPRTLRSTDLKKCMPMNLHEHAQILKQKLENIKREQDEKELFDMKLKDSNDSLNSFNNETKCKMSEIQSRELENAIKEKIQQDYLSGGGGGGVGGGGGGGGGGVGVGGDDQNILDEHISRTIPDSTLGGSPRLLLSSPRIRRPPEGCSSYNLRFRRKERDGFSTFSGDSGTIHDLSESEFNMLKSKSMSDYRRSLSKNTLTDSGVSVVSDNIIPAPPPPNNRILNWLLEADKNKSKTMNRKIGGYDSRSNSLERNQPKQPFLVDPNIPLPSCPNTTVQLEEARRRLMEDDLRAKPKQRSKFNADFSQSSQSTLRKPLKQHRYSPEDVTIAVLSFYDEQFPYRIKIPGTQITLKQFKENLPKKGNYRFFFKTVSEDVGNQVAHEEVRNDCEIVPLWEGKIMAQLKPID